MKYLITIAITPILVCLLTFNSFKTEVKPNINKLYNTIVKLDSAFFTAYNTCDIPTLTKLYNNNLEFYHDKGGLSTSKSEMLIAIKENICGKVTRTLIPGSIEVYPIAGFGAVQIGMHKFYNNQEPNALSNPSKFIVIWKNDNENWTMSRVISLHN